jgi:SAM-dependent methyltransferase
MDENAQMEFFYEIFDASMPRLGPGDDACTARALEMLLESRSAAGKEESGGKLILDLGCGNGAQTVALARCAPDATLLAVDNHGPFLDELSARARAAGVAQRVETRLADMCELEVDDGALDIVWSEGAIYIMGFREGLEACYRMLKPGGFCAVTEISWLRPDVPDECRRFFSEEYPAMADVETNLGTIADCGFGVVGHFTLPESAWWVPYYHPLGKRLGEMRSKYPDDSGRLEVVTRLDWEIEVYRRYSSFYGYEFYLMVKGEPSRPPR